jgi:hypothetical protein
LSQIQVLNLQSLSQGLPAITPAFGAAIAEAGAICLTDEAHKPGVVLKVEGAFSTQFQLDWQPVNEQTRRCWNDKEYTTEQAAYAIALLLIMQLRNGVPMNQIQVFHQQAMDLAEAAAIARLRGTPEQAAQLTRQAFEQETQAAALIAGNLDTEPTRSVLHRSAASLAIECGELQIAERLIATALSGNPPLEIAEELKDLFIQINLDRYLKRRGIDIDINELRGLVNH